MPDMPMAVCVVGLSLVYSKWKSCGNLILRERLSVLR